MIDWNKPIRTVNGRPARVIATDRMSPFGYTYVVLVDFGGKEEIPLSVKPNGRGVDVNGD